jgi:hypothetical protein
MIQTDQQFPSVSSQTKGLLVNDDGSVDVYCGPKAPLAKEMNWADGAKCEKSRPAAAINALSWANLV